MRLKASELIKKLEEMIELHGDLECETSESEVELVDLDNREYESTAKPGPFFFIGGFH